jgi:hypothetical protein
MLNPIPIYFRSRSLRKMSAISVLNPKAEVARAAQALAVNMSGAKVSFTQIGAIGRS